MAKKLMIIESPNKIKTIHKFLKNDDFKIIATYGHLRDLSKWGLGFNSKTLEPVWVKTNKVVKNDEGKEVNLIKWIQEEADKAEKIYLSTDPDREGEAISWHVYELLKEKDRQKCERITFNEITKNSIDEAFHHGRQISQPQVNSYLARRLSDREFGFKLSGFAKSRIGGRSAGRVQSIALKFLNDREKEIQNFVPEHWYNLKVLLKNGLNLNLKKVNPEISGYELKTDLSNGKVNFSTEEGAKLVLNSLNKDFVFVSKSDKKTEKVNPKDPYKTSTVQQDAINRLGLSSKVVEKTLQKLYEGVEIDKDVYSLITYPRTDRSDLSETFVDAAQKYITQTFGAEYYAGVNSKKKAKKEALVQGAHEGIRPTDLSLDPIRVSPFLSKNELHVYELIWNRALSSLMPPSIYDVYTYEFENNKSIFNVNSRKISFEGFLKVYQKFNSRPVKDKEEEQNFDLVLNEKYPAKTLDVEKHSKNPPSRYNEASLIIALEKEGIGRPSTYAGITSTVLNRYYGSKSGAAIIPTELGCKLIEKLENEFKDIMSFSYTRDMEQKLDSIYEQKLDWKDYLHKTFDSFNKTLESAKERNEPLPLEKVGEMCPECNHELIYRVSFKRNRESKFIACSGFPKCRYIRNIEPPKILDRKCPKCEHNLVMRTAQRTQKEFVGCTNYPNCDFLENLETNKEKKTTKKSTKTSKTKKS